MVFGRDRKVTAAELIYYAYCVLIMVYNVYASSLYGHKVDF